MHRVRWLVVWVIRLVVFVFLFGLAAKNSGSVDLYFYFGQHWQLPVAVVVLASCGLGVVLGLSAALTRILGRGRT